MMHANVALLLSVLPRVRRRLRKAGDWPRREILLIHGSPRMMLVWPGKR